MTFISYAQNMEDVMLWRALKHVVKGFYIDIGANDPNIDSVTKAFYKRGWRGINIEPVSQWFEKLENERPRDINLQLAVGAGKGELTFYEIPDTGLSTLNKKVAERHQKELGFNIIERQVPVETLKEICSNYHVAPIHFMKIDVEGAEKKVLEGFDFSETRPWIILIESTLPNTQTENHEDWEPMVLANNYTYVYFDGLNRYYVADEHPELITSFKIPPNLFDDFIFSGEGNSSFQQQVHHKTLEIQELLQEKNEIMERSDKESVELANSNVHSESLAKELVEKTSLVSALENTVAQLQAHSQWLESEWNAAKAKNKELNHSSHHWWTVADGLNHELQRTLNSKSWRVTWPLRKLMLFSKRLLCLLARTTLWAARQPKRTVRWMLVKLMAYTQKHPLLKDRALTWLQNYPVFETKLRQFALARGLKVAPVVASKVKAVEPVVHPVLVEMAAVSDVPIPKFDDSNLSRTLTEELSHLTPRARRIYTSLIAATIQNQKEVM